MNTALATAGIVGITASIGANGNIQFGGNVAFRVAETHTAADSSTYSNITNSATPTVYNTGVYTMDATFADTTGASTAQQVTFSVGGKTFTTTLGTDTDAASAAADINTNTTGLNAAGIFAIADGNNVLLTSANAFTVNNAMWPAALAASSLPIPPGPLSETRP